MSGFGKEESKVKANLVIYKEELDKVIKDYKKIKKYMKSSLYAVKNMDGTEKLVSNLIKESEDNPLG